MIPMNNPTKVFKGYPLLSVSAGTRLIVLRM